MIRTLAVSCAPILVCSKDDRNAAAETASDEIAVGAGRALCEFSLLVSRLTHSDLSITAIDNALRGLHQKKQSFGEQKMSKSAKSKVGDLFATGSHQLHEQKFHKVCAAMEALVCGAGMVSTTKRRQFQVRLNRAR